MGEKDSMKSFKRVIAAMFTVCLLTASLLPVEAAETGALKKAGANGLANASPVAGTLLAAGKSKTESTKKADDAAKKKAAEAAAKKKAAEAAAKKKAAEEAAKKKAAEEAAKKKKAAEEAAKKKKAAEEAAKKKAAEEAAKKKKAAEEAAKKKAAEEAAKKKKAAEEAAKKKAAEEAAKKKAAEEAAKKKAAEATASVIEKAKDNALSALSTRLAWNRVCVYVYKDYGLTQNHFTQKSKIYGSDESLVKDMDENCAKKPYSGSTCIRCEQTASKKDRGGWMFLNGYLKEWDGNPKPNDGKKGGAGLDLSGADALRFYAKGKNGGEVVEFFTCGFGYDKTNKKTADNPDSCTRKSTGQVKLTKDWKEYVIPLKGADLSYIVCGFGYEVDGKANGKKDTVFYLDEIRFTGTIRSAQTAPVLLRSSDADDKKLKNAAFTEDNALAALAFLSAGKKKQAKEILDAFVYAIQNDRAYASADTKNGPRRARNAYAAGYINAFPGWNSGTRLPGWYDEDTGKWVEDRHQVGSSVGSNSYVALALVQYYNMYGDETYLKTACSLMDWVIKNCFDHALGFTEGFDGWKESDTLEVYPLTNRPTKDNLIAYAAFSRLYEATRDEKYLERSKTAIRFIEGMYNEWKGRFITGTLEDSYTPDKSIVALNVQSLTALAMWDSFGPYLKTMNTIESMKVEKGGYPYNRYNKNGGWWAEGTAFTALMYRVFGKEDKYKEAMNALVKIQKSNGLFPAATVDNFYTGLIQNDGSSLEFTKDTHIAPTAWFIMAANGYNPFAPHKK